MATPDIPSPRGSISAPGDSVSAPLAPPARRVLRPGVRARGRGRHAARLHGGDGGARLADRGVATLPLPVPLHGAGAAAGPTAGPGWSPRSGPQSPRTVALGRRASRARRRQVDGRPHGRRSAASESALPGVAGIVFFGFSAPSRRQAVEGSGGAPARTSTPRCSSSRARATSWARARSARARRGGGSARRRRSTWPRARITPSTSSSAPDAPTTRCSTSWPTRPRAGGRRLPGRLRRAARGLAGRPRAVASWGGARDLRARSGGGQRCGCGVRRVFAVLVTVAILAAPTAAFAVDWAETRRLIRERPIACLVAIPPLLVTSPFMLATWVISGGR